MRKISICSAGARRIVGSISRSTARSPSAVKNSTYRRNAESNGAVPLADDRARMAKPAPPRARRPRSHHWGVRRAGEQILPQAVMDLARYARPLLRDGAAELGRAD